MDVEASYMAMVTMPEEKLKKVLADKEAPMLARIIAKELLGAR